MAKIKIGDLFELEKGSLQSSKCTEGEFDFITASKDWKTHNEFSHDTEALIFAAMASGSLGRTHYVNSKFITSDLCYILTPKDSERYPLNLKFYHFVFNSLKDEIVKNTKSGTSKEAINQTNLKKHEIPYFDIEQQNLWIKKLINTKDIKENLIVEIETQQNLLKKLRQSILQEAIEGKLTASWREQNPDVESASVLLEKIKQEKEQLVKENKIKRQKPLLPINEDGIPFDIPDSWEWCKVGQLIYNTSGGKSPQCENRPSEKKEWGVIKTTAIQDMYFDETKNKVLPKTFEVLEQYIIQNGDLLITRAGPINRVGIVCSVENLTKNLILSDKTIKMALSTEYISSNFMKYALNNPTIKKLMENNMTGMADSQVNISQDNMKNFLTVLAPLKEQKEIVEKIEHLFKICDKLETQINSSKINSQTLMQAVLKEAFEG